VYYLCDITRQSVVIVIRRSSLYQADPVMITADSTA
jgi:hypothetical protein